MVITNLFLTPTELKCVELLAEGKSYRIIARECGLKSAMVPQFMAALRRATGISDSREPEQAQSYLENYARAQEQPPSAEDLDVLRRVLGVGNVTHSFEALGYRKKTNTEEAKESYKTALRAIGVFATEERMQRVHARVYLAAQAPVVKPVIPLSPKRWKALRMYAAGESYFAIAEALPLASERAAQTLVKESCASLGINSRGRGVQQKLLRAALAFHDAKEQENAPKSPPAMDDPAF